MGWPSIVGAMVLTAVATGVVLGLLGDAFGFHPGAGVGAATGAVGALLIGRRAAARRAKTPPS